MTTFRRFEEIEVWQTARELAKAVYQATGQGALARDFGLRDQLRRAAVSVMSNIAEGFENQTLAQFISCLYRARGSAGEIRSQLYVALDTGMLPTADFERLAGLSESCSRRLAKFIAYLESQRDHGRLREFQAPYSIELPTSDSSG